MPQSSSAAQLLPNIKILIEGQALPPEARADLMSVDICLDLDAPDMFSLALATWDLVSGQWTWVDDALFALKSKVDIQLGYEQDLKTVMVGYITGFEPEFSADSTPTLTVRGHSTMPTALQDCNTRTFSDMTDSDIAKKIARERGLTPNVVETKIKFEYLMQNNQSDLDFLRSRASLIGYEVDIDADTLHFQPVDPEKKKALTLTYGEELLSFSPRLTSMQQTTTTEVKGWSMKEKKVITASAKAGQEGGLMGGKTSGPKAAKAFGASSHTIVDRPVSSQAEAEQIALGQFQAMASNYITAEGSCVGLPGLQVGKIVAVVGVGKRFSGLYSVTSVRHRFSPDQGYTTSFNAKRTAS